MIKLKIDNADKLKQKIAKVEKRELRNVLRAGTRKAALRFRKEAKDRAPKKTGRLKKEIRLKAGRARGGRVNFNVGIYINPDDKTAPYYGAILHTDWKVTRTNRYIPGVKKRLKAETKGPRATHRSRRQVERNVGARPFMTQAFENQYEAAGKEGQEEIFSGVARALSGSS